MVINYWIFKVKDEIGGLFGRRGHIIFDHRTSEGFWAIRERAANGKLEAKASQLKKGDYAVFYLVDKDSNRFVGTCIAKVSLALFLLFFVSSCLRGER